MAAENDSVNTGALATLVAVGAAAMIGISLAVNALVRHELGSVGAERDAVGGDAYRAMRKAQLEKLDAPAAWIDGGKGQVSIPIDHAMKLVLVDLKRSPWNATPAPPLDAGTDAATAASSDAGADVGGAGAPPNNGTPDGGATPEPPAPAPLSPVAPTPGGSSTPAPKASAPGTPAPKAPPAAPPAQPAPPSPPATTP